jgi:hypothetical protein
MRANFPSGLCRMRLYLLVPVCLLFGALVVCAQKADELSVLPSIPDEPSAVALADCPASLIVASEQTSGPESYVRLKRLVMSMELGHDVSAQLMTSLKPPSSSDSVGTALLLHTNVQLCRALNRYLCASFLTGRIKTGGAGSNDKTAIETFNSVFNRMALETIPLRAQMKAAAQEAQNGEQGMSVSMTEGISKTLEDRKNAGTDLQERPSVDCTHHRRHEQQNSGEDGHVSRWRALPFNAADGLTALESQINPCANG